MNREGIRCVRAQLRSANKFLRMASIKEWILIAPEAKVPTLVHYLEDKLPQLPCILASKVRNTGCFSVGCMLTASG